MDTVDRLLQPGRLLGGQLMYDVLRERLDVAELSAGQVLGSFRIERELARGGMGIVYRAARTDGVYEQQVAIKWLPVGQMDVAAIDRFQRERQTHVALRHPNIARLLDGGRSEDGHLWYAMEFVEGLPIDQHAATEGLDWNARIRLLLPVIEAVQFVHKHLLIHRDIKPDNILVDADGRPKLLDFGVSTQLADAAVASACTPECASPEQLAGKPVDITSDIWQLGRLVQRVMAAEAPDRPAPACPKDLAAIMAKATDVLPARRYPSATAMQDDLERLLQFRPVSAYTPSWRHRLYLLIRAHPIGTVGSALAALAFIVLTTGFMLRLAHERNVAVHAQRVAEAVNHFFRKDFLPGADPFQGGSSDISVADLSTQALAKVPASLHDLPEVAGQVDMALGHILANLGRLETAHQAYAQAIKNFTRAYGHKGPRVLRARLALQQVSIDPHSLQTADHQLHALRADILGSLGPHSPMLVEVDAQLARAAFLRGDFSLCESRYKALLPRLTGTNADMRAQVYVRISMCMSRLGHWVQALDNARKARDIDEHTLGLHNPLTLETHIAVETALVGLGRYDKAVNILRKLVDQFTHRYGPLHPTTLLVTHELGLAMTCSGHPDKGISWLRKAAFGRAQVLGKNHPWYAMTESVLGMALIQGHHLKQAAAVLSRAQHILTGHAAATPYIWATQLENEADLALAQGHMQQAVKRYDKAIAFTGRTFPTRHTKLSMLQLGRGLALVGAGSVKTGRHMLRNSLQAMGKRDDCRAYQITEARNLLHH